MHIFQSPNVAMILQDKMYTNLPLLFELFHCGNE